MGSAGSMVTGDQSMSSMLNKYFSSVFSTTSGTHNINTNDINTNDVTSSALVNSQNATTKLSVVLVIIMKIHMGLTNKTAFMLM